MKPALVHDWLKGIGGAERVLIELHKIFPEAPIYTLLHDPAAWNRHIPQERIRVSGLGRLPAFVRNRRRWLLPFLPVAAEGIDLRDFDVVISSSSAWAKGILTKPETVHISYCHTPTRFLWSDTTEYLEQQKLGSIKGMIVRRMLSRLRLWDRLAVDRVDYWVTNSLVTKERIKKYYRKDAEVIYPPVDTARFRLSKMKKDFFLVVSRLSPYKMVGLAVDAFNKLGLDLVVIGEGSERSELEKRAKSNIKFLGFQNDEEVLRYYEECRAFSNNAKAVSPDHKIWDLANQMLRGYLNIGSNTTSSGNHFWRVG